MYGALFARFLDTHRAEDRVGSPPSVSLTPLRCGRCEKRDGRHGCAPEAPEPLWSCRPTPRNRAAHRGRPDEHGLRMKRLVSACCQNTRSPRADTGVSVGSWRYLYSMSANLIYWTFSLKQSCQRGWGRVKTETLKGQRERELRQIGAAPVSVGRFTAALRSQR